jgi:hypothetical protein
VNQIRRLVDEDAQHRGLSLALRARGMDVLTAHDAGRIGVESRLLSRVAGYDGLSHLPNKDFVLTYRRTAIWRFCRPEAILSSICSHFECRRFSFGVSGNGNCRAVFGGWSR